MKNLKLYAIALLATGALASCSESDKIAPEVNQDEFVAVIADAATRTSLSDNSVIWTLEENQKDAISVFRKNGYNTKFEIKELAGNTATFGYTEEYYEPGEGFNGTVDKNYAIYPYNGNIKVDNDLKFSVSVPASQTYKQGTFDPAAAFMIAAADGQALEFKNANALVKVELRAMPGDSYDISSIVLSSSEAMNGSAKISYNGGEPTVTFDTANPEDDEKKLTLDCSTGVTVNNPTAPIVFYLAVSPGTYNNLKMTLNYSNSVSKELTIGDKEIGRNTIVTFQYICGSDDFTGTIPGLDSTDGNLN